MFCGVAQIFSHPGPTSTVTTDPGDSSPSVSDFVIFVRARCSRQQPVSLSDCCQGILCFRVPTAAGAHPSALASARAVEKGQARALTMIRFFFGRLRHFFALFPAIPSPPVQGCSALGSLLERLETCQVHPNYPQQVERGVYSRHVKADSINSVMRVLVAYLLFVQ